MFAAASNLLVLISFTVHAVIGCCVHHHHHTFTTTCVAEHAAELCCHDHACKSREVVVQHNDCSGHDEEHSTTDQNDTNSPNAPYGGSHNCNEPSCVFLSASSNSITDIRVLSSTAVSFGDSNLLTPVACLSLAGAFRHSEEARHPASSSLRCAIAQSWQI